MDTTYTKGECVVSEEHLVESMRSEDGVDIEKAREVITRPLDPKLIKQRQMSYGKALSYIEGHTVIALLNEAFNYRWSFEIINCEVVETKITKPGVKQGYVVKVLGRLTVPGLGFREQYGSQQLMGGPDVQESAHKAATTDALKKCATLFDIGRELYIDEAEELKAETSRTTDTVDAIRKSAKTQPAPAQQALKQEYADRIRELKALLGITDNKQLDAYVSEATNKVVTSYTGITDQNAQAIIRLLERDVNEQSGS